MIKENLPLVGPDLSLLEGMAVIEKVGIEAALVVQDATMVGLLTDGDCRRALLGGKGLGCSIREAMQPRFTWVGPEVSRAEVLDMMIARNFKLIPVLGPGNSLIGLHLLDDFLGGGKKENAAVIMCGGRGVRLRPLTDTCPKPMLKIAGRPILERIVLHLVGHGFKRIFLAIHYLGEMIEHHFGNGEKFGCSIEYLREERPLGTGGALGLLPDDVTAPILVMNGDLVTQFNPTHMLDTHIRRCNRATVGVSSYLHTLPFGVIDSKEDRVLGIREKPELYYSVNAGIYILDADLRKRLPKDEPATIPAILEDCIARDERVGMVPVGDEWTDVGQPEDLRQAQGAH